MTDDETRPINDGSLSNDALRIGSGLIDDAVDPGDDERTVTGNADVGVVEHKPKQHNKHDGHSLATGGLGIHVMDNEPQ